MSTCPICQAPTTPEMRNCAYCGVSLIDRKHKAPSQAPPALLSRPVVHQDPLSLEVSATPASELSTMNLTMDSMDESGDPLTVDLSGSEGDALVVETPVPELLLLEPDVVTPRITSENQEVYVPTPAVDQPLARSKSFSEPRLATIDEASDGLGPLDVDLDEHHLVFPNEPVMSNTRSPAKLSDLSGRYSLSGTENPALEPSFDLQSSALSQAVSSSTHQINKSSSIQGGNTTLARKSSLSFLGQGLLFTILTVMVLWMLGFDGSLLNLPAWLNMSPSDELVQENLSARADQTDPKASNVLSFIDHKESSADSIVEVARTANENENENKLNSQSAPNVGSIGKKNSASTVTTTVTAKTNPKTESATPSQQTVSKASNQRSTKVKSKSTSKKRSFSYNSLIKQGEKLLMRGRVRQAEALFKQAQKLNPSKAEALAQLAWCQLARKKTRSAITKFKQALSKNPVHGDSLYGLGYSYEKLNEAKQALHFFELYLRRYPNGKKVGVIKNKMRRLKK